MPFQPQSGFLSGDRRFPWLTSPRLHVAMVCVAATFLFTACKKEAPAQAPSTGTNSAASEPSRAPAYSSVPVAPAVVTTPAGEPDFAEMNREVRRWILRNQRPPKNFEEFAASSSAKFPPPPAGKKYALDKTMHVVLVKN